MIPVETLKSLVEPLPGDEPCGPDLFATGDSESEHYMLRAEDALPSRFFDAGSVKIDPSTIDLAEEWALAAPLLARSRDLRVLATLAQFAAMARNLEALAACFETIAALAETYPEALNPRVEDSSIARINALGLLAAKANVLFPLEFTPLVLDRHLRGVTLRRVALARGLRGKVGAEEIEDEAPLLAALRRPDNAPQLAETHAAISQIAAAVNRIEESCLEHPAMPFRPELEPLRQQIEQITDLLAEARPDLSPAKDDQTPGDKPASTDPGPARDSGSSPAIDGVTRAAEVLEQVEGYFRNREPSSPALILVRQSRQLVGRPLVEALDLLVPGQAANAKIEFADAGGFVLNMDRMRALSRIDPPPAPGLPAAGLPGAGSPGAGPPDSPTPGAAAPAPLIAGPVSPPPLATRVEAESGMRAVEQFYARTEPSSPIPVLLARARQFQNSSFAAILADLFPPPRR
ncbi:MAG: ImpA family type VI secretion system protein [Pararhodobacter sp.]